MSARKIENIHAFSPVTVQSRQTKLSLAPSEVRIRRNGVEFRSNTPITPWTEMTVSLQSTKDTGRVNCTGVVVACTGSRHDGYSVSMVFTSLSEKAQARLELLAYS
jgi:PilZ domain